MATSTGTDANGHDVLFEPEKDNALTDINFLVAYARSAHVGAFTPTQSWVGGAAPNFTPINSTINYNAGDGARVGPNEAGALVKSGVAKYA